MLLRLPAAGAAICLSAAGAAAPLFVPDAQGNWPRATPPFVDRRWLQHDALAIGLDAVPGVPPADTVRFVAAPTSPPLLLWVAGRPPRVDRDRVVALRPGGVNALIRVDGVTTDLGDVWAGPGYPPVELARDLRRVAALDVAPATRDLPVDAPRPPMSGLADPALLAGAALLLLVVSITLAMALMARGRRRGDRVGTRGAAANRR